MYSPLSQFDVVSIIPIYFVSMGIDLSISNLVLTLMLGIFLGILFLNGFVFTYLIPYN